MKTRNLIKLFLATSTLAGVALYVRAADPAAEPTATPETTAPANPREVTPLEASPEDPWRFGVTVPLWAPSIEGNVTVRGRKEDVSIGFDQLKDHLDASLALGFVARKERFGFYSDFGYMKFSGDAATSGGAVSAHAGLKFLVADAGGIYRLVKTGEKRPFILDGTLGVRIWYTDTDFTLKDGGGAVLFDGGGTRHLYDPIIGLRGSQYLNEKWHLDFKGDVGGFGLSDNVADLDWSASGVMSYDFVRWFTLSAGYQAMAVDKEIGHGTSKKGVDLIFNGILIAATLKF